MDPIKIIKKCSGKNSHCCCTITVAAIIVGCLQMVRVLLLLVVWSYFLNLYSNTMVLTDVIIDVIVASFDGMAIILMFVGIKFINHWMLVPELVSVCIRIFTLGYTMVVGIINVSTFDILIPILFAILNLYFFTIVFRCLIYLREKKYYMIHPSNSEITYECIVSGDQQLQDVQPNSY